MFVNSLLDDYGLTPSEFRIYGRVCRRWNKQDGCFESSREMAKACHLSDRTVRNCLKLLVMAGLLSRTERGAGFSPRFDIMPAQEWASHNKLPEMRKQLQMYRKGALRCTTAVPETQGCGNLDRRGAVQETHEGNPIEGNPTKVIPSRGSTPEGSPNRVRRCQPDPRSFHPAIVEIRSLIGKYPNKLVWDDLIAVLGEEFDRDRLKACAFAWAKVSSNMHNFAWIFEWYIKGIPERIGGTQNVTTGTNDVIGRNSRKADAQGNPSGCIDTYGDTVRTFNFNQEFREAGNP